MTDTQEEELVDYVVSTQDNRMKPAIVHLEKLELGISESKFKQGMYGRGYVDGRHF